MYRTRRSASVPRIARCHLPSNHVPAFTSVWFSLMMPWAIRLSATDHLSHQSVRSPSQEIAVIEIIQHAKSPSAGCSVRLM